MAEYIKTTDAIITTWMILRGMGYAAEDNPDMVKTVSVVFDTAPAADVVERQALLDMVTEVAVRKWNGSHFTTRIIRVIPEEALLTAPAVIPEEREES